MTNDGGEVAGMKQWRTGPDGKPELFEPPEVKPTDAAWDYYWGACPDCGRPSDNMLTSRARDHFAACEQCRTRWRIGENLFSTPDDMLFDDAEIESYREVSGDAPEWAMRVIRGE